MFYYVSKVFWLFATPSSLLGGLVVLGGVLTLADRQRRTGPRLAAIGVAGLVLAWFSPLANWLILPLEDRFAAFQDDGGPVDGVVVLGGAVEMEISLARGQLTVNDAGERVLAMADLARRHPEARLVYSGGTGALAADEPPEADGVARFLGTLGIQDERVVFENRSRTTRENALYTRGLVEPKVGERWLLVTSARHMPRAVGCFRAAGFPVVPYPVDYRTRGPQDAFRLLPVAPLDLVAKEWIGLLAYRLAGYTDALFPRP